MKIIDIDIYSIVENFPYKNSCIICE